MLRACGMIPWASSAGSRTSIRIGVWVGDEEGEVDGRVAVICCFEMVSCGCGGGSGVSFGFGYSVVY